MTLAFSDDMFGYVTILLFLKADSTRENFLQIFERKMEERNRQLKESGKHLF
jgi:hypothetical protein